MFCIVLKVAVCLHYQNKTTKKIIMKTENKQLLALLTKGEIMKLSETVRETVDQKIEKIFSAAELWNIQRNRRTRSRRYA